jgi:hypothetical protein
MSSTTPIRGPVDLVSAGWGEGRLAPRLRAESAKINRRRPSERDAETTTGERPHMAADRGISGRRW